jgi:ankyrin repeat protein
MSAEPPVFATLRTLPPEQLLLLKDISPGALGSNDQTLLHEAIAFKRAELVPFLLNRGVPVNHQNKNGQTALHYAATYGSLSATKALIEAGALPNIFDNHGNNALWAAVLSTNREPEIQTLLVRAGADATHKNKAGRSVLDIARQSQNKVLWALCGGDAAELA